MISYLILGGQDCCSVEIYSTVTTRVGNYRCKLCFRLGVLYFADINADFSVRCYENNHHKGKIIKGQPAFFCKICCLSGDEALATSPKGLISL